MPARPKTYKREVATILLTGFCVAVGWVLYRIPEIEEWQADQMVNLLTGLAFPIIGLAGAMFGVDAYGKQIRGQGYEQTDMAPHRRGFYPESTGFESVSPRD